MKIMFSGTILILTFNLLFINVSAHIVRNIVKDLTFDVPEDAKLGPIELIEKYGHKAEKYYVTTEDGYILGLFRIIGKRCLPILLLHGIFDSSDAFIIRGNLSLGITLANLGYDVWFGNMRGNKYSRNHTYLDPDRDRAFWRFGIDEIGLKDVPAMIDYILNKTGQSQLKAICHSEGTTVFFALGSIKPEYNDKVKLLVCLAPVGQIDHIKGLFALLLDAGPVLNAALDAVHVDELLSNSSGIQPLLSFICSNGLVSTVLCEDGLVGPVVGYDNKEYHNFLSTAFGHFPAGTSRQNLNQFVQAHYAGGEISMYDYGPEINIKKYNSTEPPVYDFSKVTMETALFYGHNDILATPPDVQTLCEVLPNVVTCREVRRRKMDHVDFIWGKHMYRYLFPGILKLLVEYC